ncbi:hypothetical protein D3C76_1308380 [compost metagenome]
MAQHGILDGMIRTEEGDVAMPQFQQMAGRGGGPLPVVEGDAAPPQARDVAVDQHHAGGPQGVVDELLVAERLAVHHQRLAALADQQLDRFPLLLGAVKTITHQQVQPLLHRHCGDPLDQGTEEGIRHVTNHHTHGVAGLADQGPGVGVGGVAQLGHGLLHHLAGGGTGLG